jgi:uncharacterized protein with HEPN domain
VTCFGHIRDELQFLVREHRELSAAKFQNDEKAKRAFVRSLEIVGEAAKALPVSFREKHSELPWKQMARMRDKLIHHYFGVDYPVVWDTVATDAPELLAKIEALLADD